MMKFSSFCVLMERLFIPSLYRLGLFFSNINHLLSGCKFHNMCISPVKILNPKLAWTPNDPKYIVVECGRCYECRARKQQEWFTRAYFEYKNNSKGSNFFVTLTFRNEDLPLYEDKRDFSYHKSGNRIVSIDKPVNYSFQCFNGDYITTFMKLFRQNCQRKFHNVDTSGIKFFIVPEYGENTHRAHHHAYIGVPFPMKVTDFQDIVTRSWSHGFVGASKNGGFKIKTLSALEYTAKYCCKDLSFYDEQLGDYLDKDNLDSAEYEYRYERVKNFLPRLRVSSHFGQSIIDEINKRNDKIDFLLSNRPLQLPKKNGNIRNFALPRYVVNKLVKRVDRFFSDRLGKPYFVLTDLGREFKLRQLQEKINTDITDIKQLCSPLSLNQIRGKDGIENTFVDNFNRNIRGLLNRLSVEKIAFYRNVLRFIPVDAFGKHSADWYFRRSDFIKKSLFRTVLPIELHSSICEYKNHVVGYTNDNIEKFLSLPTGRSLEQYLPLDIPVLSQLGEFQMYEKFSNLLDSFHFWRVRSRARKREKDDKRLDAVRSAFVDFVLYSNDGLVRQIV